MSQFEISTININARDATYKQCSAAAVATARCIARLSQMKIDIKQRPSTQSHIETLRHSMESQGVRKGDALHVYIDVNDEAWGKRSDAEAIALLDKMKSETKLKGDGNVIMGVLPPGVPLRVSNGQHRLHAYCRYFVDHWKDIESVKPPLNPPPVECPFAEGLSKTPAEILAQDDAYWIVIVEFIRE